MEVLEESKSRLWYALNMQISMASMNGKSFTQIMAPNFDITINYLRIA